MFSTHMNMTIAVSKDPQEIFQGMKYSICLVGSYFVVVPCHMVYSESEIVEVLEEADFTDYGREKYNFSGSMLKLIYDIRPAK